MTLYVMRNMHIEELILCSANEGGIRIPGQLCQFYMRHYRMHEEDIKMLSEGGALDSILNISDEKKAFELATLFISKGLSVNGINHYGDSGLTPLHAAVLYNDLQRAQFLIQHGADKTIKNQRHNKTPLEFAIFLQAKNPHRDWSPMIALLKQ